EGRGAPQPACWRPTDKPPPLLLRTSRLPLADLACQNATPSPRPRRGAALPPGLHKRIMAEWGLENVRWVDIAIPAQAGNNRLQTNAEVRYCLGASAVQSRGLRTAPQDAGSTARSTGLPSSRGSR